MYISGLRALSFDPAGSSIGGSAQAVPAGFCCPAGYKPLYVPAGNSGQPGFPYWTCQSITNPSQGAARAICPEQVTPVTPNLCCPTGYTLRSQMYNGTMVTSCVNASGQSVAPTKPPCGSGSTLVNGGSGGAIVPAGSRDFATPTAKPCPIEPCPRKPCPPCIQQPCEEQPCYETDASGGGQVDTSQDNRYVNGLRGMRGLRGLRGCGCGGNCGGSCNKCRQTPSCDFY
jgi:hypothetical protein